MRPAFAVGDHVTLDSTSDDEDMYTAVEVRWDKEGTPEERAQAGEDWDLPKLEAARSGKAEHRVQREPGDDRPVLRRANSGDDARKRKRPRQRSRPTDRENAGASARARGQSPVDHDEAARSSEGS